MGVRVHRCDMSVGATGDGFPGTTEVGDLGPRVYLYSRLLTYSPFSSPPAKSGRP